MIEFVTLLIGLVTGPRAVEMVAHGEVAAIELFLDGQLVHRFEEEPWVTEVDFGQVLKPHRLEASSFDADGELLGSTGQIVNYSRSSFEAAVVLDSTASGPARSGRVVWEGAFQGPPRQIDLHFDGHPLPVGPAGEFNLPAYDNQASHVLEAMVIFPDGSRGMASRTVAGEYTDQTSAVLTAVPVRSPSADPLSAASVRGWVERDESPLDAFTVSAPTGVLVVVRDDLLAKRPRTAMPWLGTYRPSRRNRSAASFNYDAIAICPRPLESLPGTFRLSRPTEVNTAIGLTAILAYRGSLVPDGEIDGRKLVKKPQRLFDSLAVAGLNAARKNTPRVVILMIGRTLKDNSQLAGAQAVAYLESIHVPLMIWSPSEESLETYGLSAHSKVFLGMEGFLSLATAVEQELKSQRIIWVAGEHLPTELSLSTQVPPGVHFPR